jgi:hypothetical protein
MEWIKASHEEWLALFEQLRSWTDLKGYGVEFNKWFFLVKQTLAAGFLEGETLLTSCKDVLSVCP